MLGFLICCGSCIIKFVICFCDNPETGFFYENIVSPPKNPEKPGFFDGNTWPETSLILGVARNRVFSKIIGYSRYS